MDKKDKTLCWDCENTNRYKCEWFDIPAKPIQGWVADRMDLLLDVKDGVAIYCESYCVRSCPNFVPIPRRVVKRERCTENREKKKVYMPSHERQMMGRALRECRVDNGMTQKKLGELLGKERAIISSYEYGRTHYNVKSVEKWLPDINEYIKAEKNKGVKNE